MNKIIPILIGSFFMAILLSVPVLHAQQKPSPVIIWCQDGSGNYAPCQAGPTAAASADNLANQTASFIHGFGFMFDGSTWDRLRGDSTNGLLVNLGTNNDVTVTSGSITANAGTNLNTSALLTTSAHDSAFGTAGSADAQVRTVQGIASMTPLQVQSNSTNLATEASVDGLEGGLGASADAAATAGSTGSLNAKQRLMTSQLDSIKTAVETIDNAISGSGVNVSQINGVTPLMGAGNTGTGSQRVTEATDSQLSAGVGATGDAAATAGSTGSITAKLRLMTSQLDTISTAIAAIQTATQLIDDDQTGASGYSYISVGTTEDEHAVKASAGRLFSITATNTNAAVRYLKCENDTAANTAPGTDTPELRIAIPGATTGAGFTTSFAPAGWAFSTALTCWLVTGAADSDVAEVAANEIMVFYTYK